VLAPAALGGCFLQHELDTEASSGVGLPPPSTVAPGATTGVVATPGGVAQPARGTPDGAAPRPSADPCEQTRARAQTILQADCAFCHQAPATLGLPLNFILDFEALSNAVSTAGTRYTVPGMPEQSRLFQRASAGEMPPAGRRPRPTQDDIAALRAWITSCPIAGPGAPRPAPPDAGATGGPPPGCGGPGQDCCLASTCNDGGCCVQGQCRGNGMACGDGPGMAGIAGTCRNGSCQNAGNVACGSPGQPCCLDTPPTCTAPRATCGMAASAMACLACGGAMQPCCANGGVTTCLAGLGCLDVGFGRVGTCQPCGAMGQRCCGSGSIAQRTCNGNLTCKPAGMADVCGP